MSEMREHNILTLIRSYRWAAQHRDIYQEQGEYQGYVVCYEAMIAIVAELKRRDRRAWSKWMHSPEKTDPAQFFMPEEDHNA
jgi:hypothetical protein